MQVTVKNGVILLCYMEGDASKDMFKYSCNLQVGMNISVVLEKQSEGGYTVHVPSLPGCISQGDTRTEALKNIKEAIQLYLDSDEESSGERVTLSV